MLSFGKKEKPSFLGTNAQEVEELEYGVKTLADKIAAKALGKAMAARTGYKMAIARCSNALSNADLTPKQAGEWTRQLNQHTQRTNQMGGEIQEQLDQARADVAKLSEAAQVEVAVDLNLIPPPEGQTQEEVDISKQLLADAEDPKAKAKQERQAQKLQKKEVGNEAKAFFQVQEARAEKLESVIKVDDVKKQTDSLEGTLAPALEKQAKVTVEQAAPERKAPPEYEQEQLQRQLAKQLQESTSSSSPADDMGL